MRLVLSLVKRFWAKNANADDVFQAGCVGLIKAIDNFDLSVGVKFSTYAVPMIIGEIKRYLRDGNSLRVSRSIRDTAYRVLKVREAIEERDEEATIDKIAAEMEVAVSEVVYALDAISDPVSLYDPVYNKAGDTLLLMDQLCDEKNNDEVWTEHVALNEAMGRLGEREKRILFLRYYEGKTQTEISEEVGISQAQVSRLEKNALNNIRINIS
jgi:RNA polymerase sigma factor, sigma-70 family